jgi:two-component system chemotaxis response regulator CheB/chemosensory pili system protein ChpB (putative protein-glutamate methylesterase)
MNSADPLLPRLALVRDAAHEAHHLSAALAEVGAPPLLEIASSALDAQLLADAGIEVLVVALGSEVDPSALIDGPPVRLVFDDLEVSGSLEGWDRARWLRHLRAKILDTRESGPPRPEGASPIPPRRPVAADAPFGAPPAATGGDPAAVDLAGDPDGSAQDRPSMVVSTAGAHADAAAGIAANPASDPNLAQVDGWTPGDGLGAEAPREVPPPELRVDPAPDSNFGFEAFESSMPGPEDAAEAIGPAWSLADGDPGTVGEPVGGLDDLLDALRRESTPQEAAGLPEPAVEAVPAPVPAPRAFDLSSLSLEPLEDERPVTGRAQFIVDDVPRSPLPPQPAVEPPARKPAVERPLSVWLVTAGDGDVERVNALAEALPRDLPLIVLLTRPASAPWFGAELALDQGDRLPIELADEVMDLSVGRIVVMSPGERAGFNRNGQLTLQPGDPAMPEALGDWMTMRALAARYGRDSGVIVFGRLRDEVLEGAIEMARAGGQVWFEASVLEESNPVVDAARAAGIAMRTGTGPELAAALVERIKP